MARRWPRASTPRRELTLRSKQADRFGCHELRGDCFDAEQVDAPGVVTAIADGEVPTDRDDEVIPACREDGAGIADHARAVDAGDHRDLHSFPTRRSSDLHRP